MPVNDSPMDELHVGLVEFAKPLLCALLLIALGAAFASPALAQTLDDAASIPVADKSITTLKATVRRVGVDIVVTDDHDRPVSGLKREDFSVTEDSKLQPVHDFGFHKDSPRESSNALAGPSLPPNTFLNAAGMPASDTAVAIFFDVAAMSLHEAEVAKGHLLSYLQQRRARSFSPPIALFVLGRSDSLHLLQGFTDQCSVQELDKEIERARSETPPFWGGQEDARFAALKRVARFLAPIPGRKIAIWYGSYFPHSGIVRFSSTVVATRDLTDQTRQFLDFLNLSRVSIYPVDVLGVRVDPSPPKNTNFAMPIPMMSDQRGFSDWNGERVEAANTFADATGGRAFYGTNDLAGAVEQAIGDGSTYYTLTYEPTNPKYDGSLRHIKVTLKKPGYNLSYRKTYYADDLNAVARATADAPESPLSSALERGLPLEHGLFVEAHLEAAGAPTTATPEQMSSFQAYLC